MACSPEILRRVPLFVLLDDDGTAVLAGQVEGKNFAVNRRAASDIQGLLRKLNLVGEQIGDLEDLLRGKLQHW